MNNHHHRTQHRYTVLYLWLAVVAVSYIAVVASCFWLARFIILYLAGAL